ncbi:hypothetical protein DFO77_10741 [Marinilabilia salmonicolor]|uniref:Uncharacterized protein n=1 Tax=Marinilabilia salmonicolor TaxID=989 RepID=A0A368V8U4_9BACT|nr:hypothetical protein DFO77_10741 [Marinilabilia salmonicolor]
MKKGYKKRGAISELYPFWIFVFVVSGLREHLSVVK